MTNIKEAIMQMALKEFTKELKNPNSEVSKKFNTMLYGNQTTGEGGLFDKFTDSSMFNNEQPRRSDDEIEEEMKRYRRNGWQVATDNIIPALGTAARTVGKGMNAYNSLLGDALIAVSNGVQSQGFDNPFAMTAALAAGKKARGAAIDVIGSGLGEIADNVSKDIKSEREKEREAELLLRERPSGQFYDARKQLTKK